MEVVEFCMVFIVFSSLGYIQDQGSHIRVTLFTDKLQAPVKLCLEVISTLSPLMLVCLMTWCVFQNSLNKASTGELSGMLGLPLTPFIMYAALGCACFGIAMLAQLFRVASSMVQQKIYSHLIIGIAISIFIAMLAYLIKGSPLANNYMILGSLGMCLLMAFILQGMPIGLAMAITGYIGMLVLYPNIKASFSMLGITPYTTASNYTYTVVPMFILMGELAMFSGISRDLFGAANIWLGRLPGGLAVASICGCAGFSAVSGDSMATAVTMASVALPEMRKKNYEPALACATLAAGGTLGILIPPSTGFIFYALVTEVSIGQLFVAGIIPGIMLTIIFSGILLIIAKRHPELAPRGQASSFQEKLFALKGVIAMLALIVLILGGILWGWFSPNEGGAVGAAGTLLYALLRRRLSFLEFIAALKATALVTTRLMLILIGVGILGTFLAATALPFDLADLVVNLNANRYVILAMVVIFYLVMGCLMSVIPMILLTLPAIYPTIVGLGFDPVWFGVVVVILMEAGQVTPPVGINVFALSSVATDVPMSGIFRRIVPFFGSMIFLVVILTIFPGLATWLPSVLFW